MTARRPPGSRTPASPARSADPDPPTSRARRRGRKSGPKTEVELLTPDARWAAALRARILADAHPFQRAAIEDEHTFQSYLVGRGGGKTTTFRARALIKLTAIRRARLVYIAPTRDMAIELMWIPLKDSLEFYGLLDDFVINESKLLITCRRTGARYRLVGLDDKGEVNKLRGRPFDEVQLDEASVYPAKLVEDLIDRAVGPRLGERHGVFIMAGTPGHILSGYFYAYTRPGSTAVGDDGVQVPLHLPHAELADHPGWDGWVSHHWTLADVAALPAADLLYPAIVALWAEALRLKRNNRWSDAHPVWKREYLAIWAADDTGMVFHYRDVVDGVPWNQWDPAPGLVGLQRMDRALAILRALPIGELGFVYAGDNGSKDPFALIVWAFGREDTERRMWQVFEHEQVGMYARTIAQIVLGPGLHLDHPDGLLGRTGWPDAAIFDADQSTIDELGNVYGLRWEKASREQNYKHGAIEEVNGELIDGRMKVLKKSRLEAQLESLQWAEDQFGIVRENKAQANHCSDCAVYGRIKLAGLFSSGVVPPPPPASPAPAAVEPALRAVADDPYAGDMDMTAPEFYDPWGST